MEKILVIPLYVTSRKIFLDRISSGKFYDKMHAMPLYFIFFLLHDDDDDDVKVKIDQTDRQ